MVQKKRFVIDLPDLADKRHVRRRGKRWPDQPSKRVLVTLPADLCQALDLLAEQDGLTRSEVVRDAIRMRLLLEYRRQQKES